MPDVFALTGVPSLARLRTPELAIAVAQDSKDAKISVIARLTGIEQHLGINLRVIEALDGRLRLRRPLPPVSPLPPAETLQNLVRRGRRRLERERQGGARRLYDLRLAAVTKLRTVLQA